jgi:prespore-specific regulator
MKKMVSNRIDMWDAGDDLVLAELTISAIRKGETQKEAFEEVARRLGRTATACKSRWNKVVRKHYEAAVQIAIAQNRARSVK